MRFLAKSLLVLGLLAAAPALAQQEPPARVGRVAVVAGELGFHGPGETAWSKGSLNYPVATGESFWTDPKSRAELRIGSRRTRFKPTCRMRCECSTFCLCQLTTTKALRLGHSYFICMEGLSVAMTSA